MKHAIWITLTTLFLTGCGGGGGGESAGETVAMEPGRIYTVYPGDRLIKNSEDTVVKIVHTQGQETSSVELIEGQASIIRK
jgi:hypothetical protein